MKSLDNSDRFNALITLVAASGRLPSHAALEEFLKTVDAAADMVESTWRNNGIA